MGGTTLLEAVKTEDFLYIRFESHQCQSFLDHNEMEVTWQCFWGTKLLVAVKSLKIEPQWRVEEVTWQLVVCGNAVQATMTENVLYFRFESPQCQSYFFLFWSGNIENSVENNSHKILENQKSQTVNLSPLFELSRFQVQGVFHVQFALSSHNDYLNNKILELIWKICEGKILRRISNLKKLTCFRNFKAIFITFRSFFWKFSDKQEHPSLTTEKQKLKNITIT